MEVLIRVVCTIVWCSTIVRCTSGDGELIKKSCQNKKCGKVSNPFELKEKDPTDIEKESHDFVQKPGDLFREVVETPDFKKITEVYDNGFYSALCWVEITTITEFKNGSNSAKREYAISFESPSNIPKKYLAKNDEHDSETLSYKIFDQDTQKSEVVNFTTTQRTDNETIRQHKKLLCGSGPIYTKEYIEWLNSNKRKIELRVSPKKQHLLANVCNDDKEEDASTVSNVTLQPETLSDFQRTNKTGKIIQLNSITKSKKLPHGLRSSNTILFNGKIGNGNPNNDSTVQPHTNFFPNNELTSIDLRLGSESFSTDGETKSSKPLNFGRSSETTWEPITDKMVEPSSQSQVKNNSSSSEKSATSTEATSSSSDEYLSSPVTVVKAFTTTFGDLSFAKDGYENDKISTEKTTLVEEFRTTRTTTKGSTKSSKINETSGPLVTISDNSEKMQSTVLNSLLTTLRSDTTTVTEVPILNPSSQKPKNVNTPKSPENITLSSTEKSESTSSVQEIPQTTLKGNYVSTKIPKNLDVTSTDDQPKSTETPQKWNSTSFALKNKPTTELTSTDDQPKSTETPQKWNSTSSTLKYKPTTEVTSTDDQPKSTQSGVPQKWNPTPSTLKHKPTTEATATSTDYQSKSTITSQKWNFSTLKYTPTTEKNNVLFPIELNKESFEKLNISLNDTSDKIVFRINFLTDYVVEGSQEGKRYRYTTPMIGVEKKVEFNSNFTKQAIGMLKTELAYNWEKFIENLIQRFFNNNGTNGDPDSVENGKVHVCKDGVGTTLKPTWYIWPPNSVPIMPPNRPPNWLLNRPPHRPPHRPPNRPPIWPPNPPPMNSAELAYNKLSSMNFNNDFLNSNQQDINNPYLMFPNQTRPDNFNGPKEIYDSINTFPYPFRKLENESEGNAILYKNKNPVYRLSNASGPKYSTSNFSNFLLPSSRSFENPDKRTTSVFLHKILDVTKAPALSLDKSDETNENGKHVGYRVDSFLSRGSNQFEDNEPRFRVVDLGDQDFTKLKNPHNSTYWKQWTTNNLKKIQVEKTVEDVPIPGYIKKMYGLFSASFARN